MLADAGEREIGQDWVFGANQTYYRLDGTTVIDTTDANGVFTFEMDNTVMASIVNANTWTGMEIDMTESTHTCDSWTVGQVTSS